MTIQNSAKMFVLTLAAAFAMAQEPASPTPAAGGAGGGGGNVGGGGGGVGTPSPGGGSTTSPFPGRQPTPGQNPNDRMQFPDMAPRPIFISGKVMLDDGTAPTEQVVIERVCNGSPRPEGYTDSKGHFSFELGKNQATMADASYNNSDDGLGGGGFGGRPGANSNRMPGAGPQITERDLMGCEIRANLAGYRSDVISLSGRRTLDNPSIGIIILHRRANVEGFTTSGTSLMAPKDAKKSLEKAMKLAKAKKPAEAQKELESAVALYPKYAEAWYELGILRERQNQAAEASEAYAKSVEADAKYIKPYLQMAGLYARENKWKEVSETSARAIKLNPYDFPMAYFYHSVASINLQDLEGAEKSAREGMKLDNQKRLPKLAHVLGVVLAQKQDFSGAADNMKLYLKMAPNASDVETVRKQLAEVEGNLAQAGGPKAAQQQ